MRVLTPAEKSCFVCFTEAAAQSGIPWMNMRNYEGFPDSIGNDVDIYIPRKLASQAVLMFAGVVFTIGGSIIHRHARDYVTAIWFRMPGGAPIHVDFYHGVTTWHGLHYIEPENLWDKRCHYREFAVPSPAHEAMTLFHTSLLWGRFIKTRYHERILYLLASPGARAAYDEENRRAFGSPVYMCEHMAKTDGEIRKLSAQLRHNLRVNWLKRAPIAATARQLCYWWGEMRTLIRPPGYCLMRAEEDSADSACALDSFVEEASTCFGEVRHASSGGGVLDGIRGAVKVRVMLAKNHLVVLDHPRTVWIRLMLVNCGYAFAKSPVCQGAAGDPGVSWKRRPGPPMDSCASMFEAMVDILSQRLPSGLRGKEHKR